MSSTDLLELGEAAKLLGVPQSTLRRWADAGKVEHIRTLSGRRRFARSAILQAKKNLNQPLSQANSDQFETKTLRLARQRTSDLSTEKPDWVNRLSEEQRLLFRYSGQSLLGLMMQFISRKDSATTFLEEARQVARDYGRICYQAGLTAAQTAEAFLYYRRSILESVQATAGLGGAHDPDSHRIILRTVDFFDALLVATIESHAELTRSG